jgi:hypothetical protein
MNYIIELSKQEVDVLVIMARKAKLNNDLEVWGEILLNHVEYFICGATFVKYFDRGDCSEIMEHGFFHLKKVMAFL